MSESPTLRLARDLIRRPSVTPEDAGCQQLLAERLAAMGFRIEPMRFEEVDNLWARHGDASPLFVFAGHTDVVPTGPLTQWRHDPFSAAIDGDWLCGRGAADMKSSIAAMVTACERFLARHPDPAGSIAFLVTSDEEGPARWGTRAVMDTLNEREEWVDWCLVGEPSSTKRLGDVIKIGRRGSLNGRLLIHGRQGHVAYPHLADNPIHRSIPLLNQLCAREWCQGDERFPPTSFQISNIQAGTGVSNVIPGEVAIDFNFRFSPEFTVDQLRDEVENYCRGHELDYSIEWALSGHPFHTPDGDLIDAVSGSVMEITGAAPELCTAGGTSDGRFIAPTGAEVVELGPVNATIHKIDERVSIQEINELSVIYERILTDLLT